MKSRVILKDQMHFSAEVEGYNLDLDANPEHGGQNAGARPKELLLTSLAGCTAMDVISILRKMQIEPDALEVEASGELADEHPRVFTSLHVVYRLRGADIPLKKVEKAVTLSQDRYCGVSAMLAKAAEITWDIELGA